MCWPYREAHIVCICSIHYKRRHMCIWWWNTWLVVIWNHCWLFPAFSKNPPPNSTSPKSHWPCNIYISMELSIATSNRTICFWQHRAMWNWLILVWARSNWAEVCDLLNTIGTWFSTYIFLFLFVCCRFGTFRFHKFIAMFDDANTWPIAVIDIAFVIRFGREEIKKRPQPCISHIEFFAGHQPSKWVFFWIQLTECFVTDHPVFFIIIIAETPERDIEEMIAYRNNLSGVSPFLANEDLNASLGNFTNASEYVSDIDCVLRFKYHKNKTITRNDFQFIFHSQKDSSSAYYTCNSILGNKSSSFECSIHKGKSGSRIYCDCNMKARSQLMDKENSSDCSSKFQSLNSIVSNQNAWFHPARIHHWLYVV